MRTDASDVAAGDTPGRGAPINRKPVIDHNLVVDGLLFATLPAPAVNEDILGGSTQTAVQPARHGRRDRNQRT